MQGVPDTMKFGVVQKMRILVLIIISIVVYWLTYVSEDTFFDEVKERIDK